MKITSKVSLRLLAVLGASFVTCHAAHAQVTATGDDRLQVDLRDATLYDALDMVFRGAGIGNYTIDQRARVMVVGKASFNNRKWDDIVRVLANENGFRLRNINNNYNVDLRPAPVNTMPMGSTMPNMGAVPGMPNNFGMPNNLGVPGANPVGNIDTFAGRKMSLQTRPSPQIMPGGRQNAGQGGRQAGSDSFTLLTVNHVYAGGIALLFDGASVLSTRELVVPNDYYDYGSSNNNNNGNGNNNNLGGNGNIGGNIGNTGNIGGINR